MSYQVDSNIFTRKPPKNEGKIRAALGSQIRYNESLQKDKVFVRYA